MPVVNPDDYPSMNPLLDALRYTPTDEWSYVLSTEEYNMYYNQGEYIGHGIGLIGDGGGSLWTGWVYNDSPAKNQIENIVVDLRYNPGGQVDFAQHLGSLISGEFAIKRDFVKLEYNDQKSERNLTRPFDIYLVGDDTHGKPFGSIAASYVDSTLIPITFRYMNRKNEGEFFDGLPANSYLEEDITKDFGDSEETLLQEVLYFIENGSFTGSGVKKSIPSDPFQWVRIPLSGAI